LLPRHPPTIFCVALCSGPSLISGTLGTLSLSLSLSLKVPAKDKATPGSTNDNRNKQLLKEKKQKKSTTNTEHIIHAKKFQTSRPKTKKINSNGYESIKENSSRAGFNKLAAAGLLLHVQRNQTTDFCY
jgi:hypothetical protein